MALSDGEPMQVVQWLQQASLALATVDTPRLDADLLMCHVLQCDRTKLYAWPEQSLSQQQQTQLDALLQRRLLGEPVAYLTGWREFWSMNFEVDKDVLVPRPETELMVELALQALPLKCDEPVLDAGTGSGAIAIALYLQWQKEQNQSLTMVASDISTNALALAKRNADRLNAHIEFVHSDWLADFPDNRFGLILTNPPYLATSDPHLQNNTLDFEPQSALVSGPAGLDAIQIIVEQARRVAKPGGQLFIEHGFEQASAVQTLMRAAQYTNIQTHKDINDLDRVTSGHCPNN